MHGWEGTLELQRTTFRDEKSATDFAMTSYSAVRDSLQ
jgi:hypothetical protein